MYSFLDSTYHACTRLLPTQPAYKDTFPLIECVPEDAEHSATLHVSAVPRALSLSPYIDQILELADLIHAIDPSLEFKCTVFEKRLMQILQGLFLCVTFFNPVFTVVFDHPYLFSIELKLTAFKLCSLDMYSSLSFAQANLLDRDQRFRDGRSFWTATVRRDHVFEDGSRVLRELGPGALQLEVQFEGESGFGSGPTHEFCELMAKALCLRSRHLWRNSDEKTNENSEFAFTEIGLFPRPDADPELFYVLGIFVAKSISRGIVLPLPLSEQFCKLLRGDQVELAEVDPQYAKVISDKSNLVGLAFSYPGLDNFELIENGKETFVTEENAGQFVKLLREFTVGEGLARIVQRFNDGFYSVIERGVWEKFSPCEMTKIISGDPVSWTRQELDKYIKFEGGYSSRSTHARMLLDILTSFDQVQKVKFLKFLTGCGRLPIGGLKYLRPRITVAKRVDDAGDSPDRSLPTVATCSNYLKLPAYSCQPVMLERILLAISEGSDEFGLS
jgi:E3 ubiquitin-protein ligase TRIP12